MDHLSRLNLLTDCQHGFRKQRSCETQLIITVDDLAKNLDANEQVDVILLDFSKAFDKVPHRRLLHKLQFYGVRGSLLCWIKDFLRDRQQKVILDGKASNIAPVVSGVPQGTVLGPLLILVYINDLPEGITSTTRLFADDSIVYRKVRSVDDCFNLQQDLDRLQQWEKRWLMSFNQVKCEVLRVHKNRKPIDYTYTIHEQPLALVENVKYLGLNITKNLSWNKHIDIITKKAHNSISFLQRNLHTCPPKTKTQAYNTLVRPILEYSSVAWDPHTVSNTNKLEGVQRRAARFILNNYSHESSVTAMLNTLEWDSLKVRRTRAKAIMIYKVIYKLVAIPSSSLISNKVTTRGHQFKYIQPHARTGVYQSSFFPSSIRIWNSLPQTLLLRPTLDSFKEGLLSIPI